MINIKFILEERYILNEAEEAASEETEAETEAETQEPDWGLLYNGCKTSADFVNFWDGSNDTNDPEYIQKGYWKTAWGEAASTVRNFGKTWIKFLILNGFTAEDNCFIAFLENVKANKLAAFKLKLSDIQPEVYQAMLKAYTSNDLSEKYLRLEGDSLKNHSLIYYPGFYASLGTEVEALLELQNRAHNHGKTGAEFQKIFCQGSNTFKLNPLDKIKKALKAAGVNEKETISDKKAQELLDSIKDVKTAQTVLAALYIAYSVTNAQAFDGIEGIEKALSGVQITPENAKKVLIKFKLTNTKASYKNETAALIIKGLVAKILEKTSDEKVIT